MARIGLVLGAAGLVATAALARSGTDAGERAAFRAANELPDAAYPAVWLPMQYGSFGTVPALAALAWLGGRRRLAGSIAAAGSAAWVLAKATKLGVGRGRPAQVLDDVRIRGKEEGDLGFPSGHAAVSAAITTVALPTLGPAARVGAVALAGFVSFSRVYIGAHLPLDVVGGASLGVALGSAARLIVGERRPGSDP